MSCSSLLGDAAQANQVVGTYAQVMNVTRAFAEMSKPLSSAASGVISKLSPLHIVGLVRAPLDAFLIGGDMVDAVKAPSYLKLLPLMMIVEKIGNILDYFTTSVWIAEQMGAVGIEALSAATLPIGAVALGLQSIGIGIMSWKIYEIHASWKEVQAAIDGNDKASAVDLLTNEPATKLGKYKKRFFGVLSDDHKVQIRAVYDKAITEADPAARLDPMLKLLKDRHFQKQLETGICIALAIIGVVGIALVTFSGGVAIPVAWGILGVVALASLALLVTGIYKERSFNQSLLNCLN